MRLKRHAETHALKKAVEKNTRWHTQQRMRLKRHAETHALEEACGDACA
jgi:tRNA(Arg) A34 adenosine deaminase TadA